MKKAVWLSLVTTIFSGAALAQDASVSTDTYFDRVEARYVDFEDYEPDVFGLSARAMLTDDIYITGDYFHHSYSGASLDQVIAGIGYKYDFSEQFSAFADVNGGYADGSGGYDESGYALQAGTVYRLNESVEFSGLLRHVEFDENTQELELSARWYLNDKFSFSATYFGYTDLMVDGAPSPHQSDTTLRWLIDRLRS